MIKFEMFDMFNLLFEVIEKNYGKQDTLIALSDLSEGEEKFPLGCTDFDNNIILIHYDQNPNQMMDVIAHEMSHWICGYDSDHDDRWKQTYKNIHDIYQQEFLKLKD